LVTGDDTPSSADDGFAARVVVRVDRDGLARAGGNVRLRAGTSTTVLVAEQGPTTASCADADRDGVGGLTGLTFTLRDVRTGEQFLATVVPDEEADRAGPRRATLRLGGSRTGGVFPVSLTFRADGR